MAAPGVGIVEQEQLSGMRLEVAHCRNGVCQRAQVHGDMRRLRDHLAIGVEQRRRGVAPLTDVRGQGAVHEHKTHLLRD